MTKLNGVDQLQRFHIENADEAGSTLHAHEEIAATLPDPNIRRMTCPLH
ncbi:hypothetical protein [Trinickia symbiotica]|nr:hypothetical protein [Trinickia symbiotica]